MQDPPATGTRGYEETSRKRLCNIDEALQIKFVKKRIETSIDIYSILNIRNNVAAAAAAPVFASVPARATLVGASNKQ